MGNRFIRSGDPPLSRTLPLVAALLVLGARPTTAGQSPGGLLGGPDTFWLDFTNIALGLVTLEACLWVAWGIAWEAVLRRRLRRMAVTASRGLVLLVAVALVPRPAGATVEMQNQAKKLGFEVHNCLHCHASPHAVEKMKEKAKVTGMTEGNCLACHGANIPITLNQRGNGSWPRRPAAARRSATWRGSGTTRSRRYP